MASEAVQALAFVARRSATRSMPATRWAHVLSLELGWMAPARARAYVAAAEAAGVLQADGDALRLAVDPATVQVLRGFRPDPDAVPVAEDAVAASDEDPFRTWLDRVVTVQGTDAGAVMAAVVAVQERFAGRLEAMPALLVVARESGLDVRGAAAGELERVIGSP